MQYRVLYKIACAILAVMAMGCSSAKMVTSWRDPQFAGPIQFKKTAVLVLYPDPAVRRSAEDEIVRVIGPGRAVAGYTLLGDERRTADQLKDILRANSFDGAITLKVISSRQEATYVPGSRGYGELYDSYGRDRRMVDPGYTVVDTIVRMQTSIYDLGSGKPIWIGSSESFNPEDIRSVVRDIAKAVGQELRKEKLLAG